MTRSSHDAGLVSGAPNLPEGFADTFTSRFVAIVRCSRGAFFQTVWVPMASIKATGWAGT